MPPHPPPIPPIPLFHTQVVVVVVLAIVFVLVFVFIVIVVVDFNFVVIFVLVFTLYVVVIGTVSSFSMGLNHFSPPSSSASRCPSGLRRDEELLSWAFAALLYLLEFTLLKLLQLVDKCPRLSGAQHRSVRFHARESAAATATGATGD